MKPVHAATPWRVGPHTLNDEVIIYNQKACIATVPIWQHQGDTNILLEQAYADAAFIVRACNAHDELVAALRLALDALNTAPRFRVGDTNSYKIASRLEAALAE